MNKQQLETLLPGENFQIRPPVIDAPFITDKPIGEVATPNAVVPLSSDDYAVRAREINWRELWSPVQPNAPGRRHPDAWMRPDLGDDWHAIHEPASARSLRRYDQRFIHRPVPSNPRIDPRVAAMMAAEAAKRDAEIAMLEVATSASIDETKSVITRALTADSDELPALRGAQEAMLNADGSAAELADSEMTPIAPVIRTGSDGPAFFEEPAARAPFAETPAPATKIPAAVGIASVADVMRAGHTAASQLAPKPAPEAVAAAMEASAAPPLSVEGLTISDGSVRIDGHKLSDFEHFIAVSPEARALRITLDDYFTLPPEREHERQGVISRITRNIEYLRPTVHQVAENPAAHQTVDVGVMNVAPRGDENSADGIADTNARFNISTEATQRLLVSLRKL